MMCLKYLDMLPMHGKNTGDVSHQLPCNVENHSNYLLWATMANFTILLNSKRNVIIGALRRAKSTEHKRVKTRLKGQGFSQDP